MSERIKPPNPEEPNVDFEYLVSRTLVHFAPLPADPLEVELFPTSLSDAADYAIDDAINNTGATIESIGANSLSILSQRIQTSEELPDPVDMENLFGEYPLADWEEFFRSLTTDLIIDKIRKDHPGYADVFDERKAGFGE